MYVNMTFYIIFQIYFFLLVSMIEIKSSDSKSGTKSSVYARSQLHDQLNQEMKNAICCANNMRCCKNKNKSPNLEIRAVLVRCPNTVCEGSVLTRRFEKPIYSAREFDIKQFQGFDDDEPLSQSTIRNCRKKLLLTIKLSGSCFDGSKNEYIVVDHVYDPVTRKNTRILTPYVIKLKQEPIMQMYGLKFVHVVNSKAYEEIYNKHDMNYTGCDTTSSHPTCGKMMYNGNMIPYSQGFCCSCDPVKNTKRQPVSLTEYAESVISYSDPAFLLDGVECPRNLKGGYFMNEAEYQYPKNKTRDSTFSNVLSVSLPKHQKVSRATLEGSLERLKRHKTSHNPKDYYMDFQNNEYYKAINDFIEDKGSSELNDDIKNLEVLLKSRNRPKRQVTSSGAQRRGGQNCADRYTPKGLDPNVYHESTHCLRFSDLWYTVYHLQSPIVEHSISFQLFEKHEDMNGRVMWRDITRGKMVNVGTIKDLHINDKNLFSFKYVADKQKIEPAAFSLNYKTALLLIPEATKKEDLNKHPEAKGGPPEYLVVHSNQISLEGDQCNVAGVGFEAFVKQPSRCSKPKGSCLANQPYNLWIHDHKAEKLGKRGCFFLKHYGNLPKNPIRRNPKTDEQYLVMEYLGNYASTVDIEIKADFNTVLRPQSSAKITEVYVDGTSSSKTIITVKITNSGLTSSSFMAILADCPLEMPASFNNIQSRPVLIPPQHEHVFHLQIKCSLPVDRFHCSVEALNCKGELVALRRIRLQKFDRCICTWHCLCACVGSSEGLKCIPMSLQHYHAAGFQGSLPVTSYVVHYTFFDDVLSLLMYIFFFLVIILLTLGFLKASIGLVCCASVGSWGLDIILELPKPMKRYHESRLADRKLLYDEAGWPVHPDTKQKVRSISRSTEFCINTIFFFAYPFHMIILFLKRICCPQYANEFSQRNLSYWYKDNCYRGDTEEPCWCASTQVHATNTYKRLQATSSELMRKRRSFSDTSAGVTTIDTEEDDLPQIDIYDDILEHGNEDSESETKDVELVAIQEITEESEEYSSPSSTTDKSDISEHKDY